MSSPQQSRIGDIGLGVCPHHTHPESYTTVFVSGADSVLVNDSPCAIVGTIGISTCGHMTVALTGSTTVTSENQANHRIGDIGINYGLYTTVTGSNDVFTG